MIKVVAFDLDGTLLNTLENIGNCYNRVLTEHGFSGHPHEAYKQFIGNGARQCLIKCLEASSELANVTEQKLDGMLADQQADYERHWKKDVMVYPGINDLLCGLEKNGTRTAVLTNKDHDFARACIDHFFTQHRFDLVQGYTNAVPHKPNPIGALKIAKHTGVHARDILLLGDSNVDMQTAQAAGFLGVGALWGFREEKELLEAGAYMTIEYPTQLLEIDAFRDDTGC